MRRHMEDHSDEVKAPNMAAMFQGTLKERRELLHQWLQSGEVPEKCEMMLTMQRSTEEDYDAEEQLLTVEGMKRAGISEKLASILA